MKQKTAAQTMKSLYLRLGIVKAVLAEASLVDDERRGEEFGRRVVLNSFSGVEKEDIWGLRVRRRWHCSDCVSDLS
jgi:hypothetical protein